MSAISVYFGEGGANLVPAGGGGAPSLAQALRDIADDLASVKGATVAAPALLAFTDPPAAAEMALLRTLVNEIRAGQITRAAVTLLTTKV